jgi:hypothetical protein
MEDISYLGIKGEGRFGTPVRIWQKQDYSTIVLVAKRVPDAVIQEDPALLMYLDNATMRSRQ